MTDEKKRLDEVFRGRSGLSERYSLDNPGNRFNFEWLCGAIAEFIREKFSNPGQNKYLDIGSGEMFWADAIAGLGFKCDNCCATDLLFWRLQKGRSAGIDLPAVAASGDALPFKDGCFDLVSQLTVFTSVLKPAVKEKIASEMLRVLKPGGYLLWYDFRIDNPNNPDTKAIGKTELRRLFPGLSGATRTITLLPPLARKIKSRSLLKSIAAVPMLRSHYLAFMGPKE